MCDGTLSRKLLVIVLVIVQRRVGVRAGVDHGTVKDTSGAVLPGVTVEAASPALIEKVRSAVTDGTGQYRIVDLRAGTYAVTFTLTGFNTVKREGIELTGSFTARSTRRCGSARSRRRSPSPAKRRSSTCRASGARRR